MSAVNAMRNPWDGFYPFAYRWLNGLAFNLHQAVGNKIPGAEPDKEKQ